MGRSRARMDDSPRPLIEHLSELRQRLFWALGAWLLLAVVAGYWARDVFEILILPAVAAVREKGHTLLLYHAWAFISPGLYAKERRFALPFVASTFLLFLAGCSFGYFFAFPTVFNWFLSLEADYVTTAWTTQAVFSFVARLYVVFGLAFELPIVIVFLALAGIVTPDGLARSRRYAILASFVAAAVLTPADPASQIMLAIPLVLLYEAGIWTARLLVRRQGQVSSTETG